MPTEPSLLLAVANSARFIAESARRDGYRVQALDAFCDRDTRALAHCTRVPMRGTGLDPDRLCDALDRILPQGDAAGPDGRVGLVYGAGLERCPERLAGLAQRVRLLGNDPRVLTLLAEPARWLAQLDTLDIPHPETRLDPPPDPGWLLKEPGSSGGQCVRRWHPGDPRPESPHCFQRELVGLPMSILFLADGRAQSPIGDNRLLVADQEPGRPFLFGGAVGRADLDPASRQEVLRWCTALSATLGLRGANCLDFILYRGRPWLLELNPRPSATLALHERAGEGGWMRRHVRACLGELPDRSAPGAGPVRGQRILYAPRDLTLPVGLRWPDWSRDRPAAGARIAGGAPLCSVLAECADPSAVETRLAERAAAILGLVVGQRAPAGPRATGSAAGRRRP